MTLAGVPDPVSVDFRFNGFPVEKIDEVFYHNLYLEIKKTLKKVYKMSYIFNIIMLYKNSSQCIFDGFFPLMFSFRK